MPSIFISYRREDTGGEANHLSEALSSRFGSSKVFIDIAAIDPGVDFERRIQQALDSCQLALVLIGPSWLTLKTDAGERRIDAPGDVVRKEVEAALERPDVTVIPVLVEGAEMPAAAQLPPSIAGLAKFNAFDLTNKRWQYDLEQLTRLAQRFDTWWWRLLFRTPRLVLRAAPIATLLIAIGVAIAVASGGGPDRAARIAACERGHGMSAANVTRGPRPGETELTRSQLAPDFPGAALEFAQTTYASCAWPPPIGADPDGYRAITVTTTNGPGKDDASGRDFEDVIESPCKQLELYYEEEFMGVQTPWHPFRAAMRDIWAPASSGPQYTFTRLTTIGGEGQSGLQLPFYPPAGSILVLHSQQVLQKASCVA